ncbi:GGDEF domain-containing protein [Deinococcus sp. Arct2-2]|uniref:GGDEF domain-containing protein n=1 Tax=Deinococcus sp. Arct2-2 TaxID=2568653 RepID=UPI0010A58976|nr:GGDEF domain-containing protein [Deinococcus sp. Arct2-2]THF68976.1 GGDEF domain-containing protein [Deinococcus sp. Arct2-2]
MRDGIHGVARHVLPLLAWGAYIVVFPSLYLTFGVAATALAYLIVAGAASVNGAKIGLLHGLLSLPAIVTGFYRVNGVIDVPDLFTAGAVSVTVGMLMGALVGHLHDLRETLSHQARTDALTGLVNRTTFAHRLAQIVDRSRRTGEAITVAYIDLDRFKPINDQYGHHVGDEVLRQLSGRLQEKLGPLGTVGRLGGDEFVFLLEQQLSGHHLPELITHTLSAPLSIEGQLLSVGASVGVYTGTGAATDAPGLMRAADAAMYAVKAARRDARAVDGAPSNGQAPADDAPGEGEQAPH